MNQTNSLIRSRFSSPTQPGITTSKVQVSSPVLSKSISHNKSLNKILTKIATKKTLKDLIQNDVENVFDLFVIQRNSMFETLFDMKKPMTDATVSEFLALMYNGLILLILERIDSLSIDKDKFPKLWESKASHLHLWLQNILKSVDEKFPLSLVTNFLFKDFEQYLYNCLFKNKTYLKKLRDFVDNLITKKYKSASGETNLVGILKQVKKKGGVEKMLTFLFVQIFEHLGVNMSICLSNQGGNRKKKVKMHDSYKKTGVTVDLVLILLNNGKENFSLCFGFRTGKDKKILSAKKLKKIDNSVFQRFKKKDARISQQYREKLSSRLQSKQKKAHCETFDHPRDQSLRSNSSLKQLNYKIDKDHSAFSKRSTSPRRRTKKSLTQLKKISENISEIKKRMNRINRVKVKVAKGRKAATNCFNSRKNSMSENKYQKSNSGLLYADSSNFLSLIALDSELTPIRNSGYESLGYLEQNKYFSENYTPNTRMNSHSSNHSKSSLARGKKPFQHSRLLSSNKSA